MECVKLNLEMSALLLGLYTNIIIKLKLNTTKINENQNTILCKTQIVIQCSQFYLVLKYSVI